MARAAAGSSTPAPPAPRRRPRRAAPAAAGLALLLLAAATAGAQPIRATVDRVEATLEDPILLTITVESRTAAAPVLPPLPDFDVQPAGQSSQIQMLNGRTTASTSYNYVLYPKRPGTFTIGPATVSLEGESHASRPFSVRILAPGQEPQARDLFVTAEVSDRRPYVGEQVIYTWKFFRRVMVGGANLTPQEFDGFLVEDLGELREYRSTVEGQEFAVSELRMALFPQREGELTIPSSRLTCQVVLRNPRRRGSFFDDVFGRAETETRVLRSPEITLDVQPLPPAPRGFSGLVGEFDLAAEVSKRELAVGESTTLKLTVTGKGNVLAIGEPPLPELPGFKIYDDKPSGAVTRGRGGLAGSKSFHKALVPLTAGELTIPSVPLTFFDPAAGTYRTAATPRLTLAVRPAEGTEELRLTESLAPTTGKVAVKILADDILPIYKGLDAVAGGRLGGAAALLWQGALVAPPLAFVGVWAARRRHRRYQLDAGLRRRRTARRRALAAARRLEAAGRDGDAAVAEGASRCLREYVGDKLGLAGSALTAAEVEAELGARGVDAELVRESRELLERLEAARYGARGTTADPARLAAALRPLLKRLDRQLPA